MPITVAGTQITFNDSTTQSTAFTGAPTTYGAVGTYVMAFYSVGANASLAPGATVAGSTLFRGQDFGSGSDVLVSAVGAGQGSQYNVIVYAIGTTTLSLTGTWRHMTYIKNNVISGISLSLVGLFVRIS